jgi:PfaD family protein
LLERLDAPLLAIRNGGQLALSADCRATLGDDGVGRGDDGILALVPAMLPTQLGDEAFRIAHNVRLAYMAGSMANGIASVELVAAAARGGMLASFGAAGLSLERIERAIDRLAGELPDLPYAFNLIHSPNEPGHEAAVVDLYLRRGVRLVEASAYLRLTLPAVRFRVHGIAQDASGNIVAPNRIIAKASRTEVAQRWLSPPPADMLSELVRRGEITSEQARMAESIPLAEDLTAEADSGGHTDNRPAVTLVPSLVALARRLTLQHGYAQPLRVGAAGGIATPHSVAAALALGASYIVTGSINQACVESGSSDRVRKLLAQAEQADVAMAPAADMFEMGVNLQVLRRGTMFAMRAAKLYQLYRQYDSLEAIPAAEREQIEKTHFQSPIDEIWRQTREFFSRREPAQVERAESDPKHRMALVFRWYLGLSSRWANQGEPTRQIDYQIWCGPAMGAFNEWTRETPLAEPTNRRVAEVGWNLMYSAALVERISSLARAGLPIDGPLADVRPIDAATIESWM